MTRDLRLSYFTGEQHSENFDAIIHLAEDLGYWVQIYESKESSQFDFLQAVYRDTVVIVDATIPDNLTLSTVYPVLTAHINILDHLLVFSDKYYDNGSQILPLNITPKRSRTDRDLLSWLREQLEKLKECQHDDRFEIESKDKLAQYKIQMESVISASLKLHKRKSGKKTPVMISYRNSCSAEVERLKLREEAKGDVEIIVLAPGSLCDDYEAHTPMRRWMLAGLLEDHIRSVKEVWVYYNSIYTNSWWTLAEMVMLAYVNYGRAEDDRVKLKVYDAENGRFMEAHDTAYPSFLHVKLSDEQYKRLTRFLSNTRPDTMGPEMLLYVRRLKRVAWIMRLMTKKRREMLVEQMRVMLEYNVPSDMPDEERNKMVNHLLEMYSNPKEMIKHANDVVFKEKFWGNISYQTERVTSAFKNGVIDVDAFIDAPMHELTKLTDDCLRIIVNTDMQVELRGNKYSVCEGKQRYLWLATRSEIPTVKDAPGIEIIQTYNLMS